MGNLSSGGEPASNLMSTWAFAKFMGKNMIDETNF